MNRFERTCSRNNFFDDAGDGLGGDFGDSTNDGGDDAFGLVLFQRNKIIGTTKKSIPSEFGLNNPTC